MMKTLAIALIAGSAATASGQLTLNLVNQIDLVDTQDPASASFIGSNPSAVGWDGNTMYVAGWNNGRGAGTDHGLVGIANAASSDALGTAFGQIPTPDFRGYNSVDVQNGRVLAGYDGGSANPQGLAIYNGATGALEDSRNERVAFANFDPSNGGDVAWSVFGSGRLRVVDQNNLPGPTTFDGTNGPVIFAGSTIQRGQDIDDNGNITLNDANGNLTHFTRTGAGSTGTQLLLASGLGVGNGNNNAILNTGFGDFVLFNDRGGNTYGSSIAAVDTSGNSVSLNVNGVDLSTATSTGWWDFDYDSATGTLAAVEFSTRQAFVFQVVPAPASAALLGLGGLAAARRRR
ncbi:MAG: PEP-CTERM sorting domain-containing protein [Planctomycetota bacterium]